MADAGEFRTGAKSAWGWRPAADDGVWRVGCAWARPFAAAAPWATLAAVLALFALMGDVLVAAPGIVFDLPATAMGETALPGLTALVSETAAVDGAAETLVFFDDARYRLSDPASADSLARAFGDRAAAARASSLVVIADRRVPSGKLMALVALARRAGVKRVQVAERRD